MKKLIITVLMMCFAQGAFGSGNVDLDALFDELIKEEAITEAKDIAAETAGLSARERAYVLRRAGSEITINISSLDGTTFNVSVARSATMDVKRAIFATKGLIEPNITLHIKGVEDELPSNNQVSSLG